jgi:protein-S-isoprenylcysteine O-methyltransferase Ste14
MDTVPLWLLGSGLALVLILLVEVGYRLYARLATNAGAASGGENWWQIGGISLNLLCLLLAFTVSIAAGRFEQRRVLVVDEANAISTTYLRAQMFGEPARGRLSALISQYARERRDDSLPPADRAAVARGEAQADSLQAGIWVAARSAVHQQADSSMTTPFLQATNQMFDLAVTRQASMQIRIPGRIVLVLVTFSMITAIIVGASRASVGPRQPVVTTLVVVMIAATIGLIVDLDRPRSGRIIVPQAQLDRVSAEIARSEAANTVTQTPPR